MIISLESLNQMENWLKKVESKAIKSQENTRYILGVQKFIIDNKLETLKADIN